MTERSKKEKQPLKLFGGVRMTWFRVVLMALAAGVITALAAMLIPEGNSFHEIAVKPEAWVLFAIFIIANCQKPLEAALKTFVFFLLSQPLVYLIQVPFSWMGWGLFRYYRYWFFITLLTLPGGFIGWYIKRDDLLSGLVLSVMLVLLVLLGVDYTKDLAGHFPRHLVSVLFCFGQILLYVFCILRSKKARILALSITAAALVFFGWKALSAPEMDTIYAVSVDENVYSVDENWTVRTENEKAVSAELGEMGDGTYILRLHMYEKSPGDVILQDGEGNEYRLKVLYEDGYGIRITDESGYEW